MGLDNPLHIAFLLVVLLLVFGAKRLPEIGRSIGTGMREFKDSISGINQESAPMLHQGAQQPQAPIQQPVQAVQQQAAQAVQQQPVATQAAPVQAPPPPAAPAVAPAPASTPPAPVVETAPAPAQAPAEPAQQA